VWLRENIFFILFLFIYLALHKMKFAVVVLLLLSVLAVAQADIIDEGKQWEMQHPQIFDYTLSAIGIILGLIFVFFGYRLFRPILGITGFIAGAGICFYILYYHTSVPLWVVIVAPIGAGIALAVLMVLLSFIGIFLLGAVGGFLLVCLFLGSSEGGLIHNKIAIYVLLGAIPFACGVISLLIQKILIILATSFAGSYAVLACIDRYVQGGFSQVIPNIIGGTPDQIHADYKTYIEIGACVLLFVIGVFVQHRHTGKNYHHKHTKEGYEAINN